MEKSIDIVTEWGWKLAEAVFKSHTITSPEQKTNKAGKRIMLTRVKILWRYLCYFIFAKKIWSQPRQSKVLIYDAANLAILMEYLRAWEPEVLHVRGEQIYMEVFLRSLFRRGTKSDAYMDCFIEKVRPRLVITLIDNAAAFYSISARHPGIKTLLMQNGIRAPLFVKDMESLVLQRNSLQVDYMMPFGSGIGAVYSKYIQGSIVPMGSILNNRAPLVKAQQQGVIAFISQWHTPMGDKEEYWNQANRLVIRFLLNYAKKNNKRLMIIRRNHQKSDLRNQEEAYFKDLVGSKPEFFESKGCGSGYQAVDSAEIVVALDSTLGHESIARGSKTAIFSILCRLLNVSEFSYGWPGDFPDEGLFWTNNPDPDSFARILDYLFEVDDLQWQKDVEASNFSSIMVYDPGNTIFRSILDKELGAFPTSSH